MLRRSILAAVLLAAPCVSVSAWGDEVIFNNGDKVTGTIDAGKMTIKGTVAGDITVDMSNVKTFHTDSAADVRTKEGQDVTGNITGIEDGKVRIAGTGQTISLDDVKKINPPPEKWTGSVTVGGSLERGNTHSEDLTAIGTAELRRDNPHVDDRFTLNAAFNFAKQRDDTTGNNVTTTENWMGSGKYDRFWTEKFYTYGLMEVDHDRIADLDYRLAPGGGIGYQWVEKPTLNINTEAGISYLYEDYFNGPTDQNVTLRLAYHIDKKLNDAVTLFSDGQYLPAFQNPGDYVADLDAGVRAKLVKSLYSEFRIDFDRNSDPPDGSLKNDLKYTVGLGWQF
jgi:putative salt-induced outer membrane protein